MQNEEEIIAELYGIFGLTPNAKTDICNIDGMGTILSQMQTILAMLLITILSKDNSVETEKWINQLLSSVDRYNTLVSKHNKFQNITRILVGDTAYYKTENFVYALHGDQNSITEAYKLFSNIISQFLLILEFMAKTNGESKVKFSLKLLSFLNSCPEQVRKLLVITTPK